MFFSVENRKKLVSELVLELELELKRNQGNESKVSDQSINEANKSEVKEAGAVAESSTALLIKERK